MYANQEAIHYKSIFAALYQNLMSVALPGSGTDVPVYIDTSNKISTIDLVRRVHIVTHSIWKSSGLGHYDLRKPYSNQNIQPQNVL